jgi:hypothetical protein
LDQRNARRANLDGLDDPALTEMLDKSADTREDLSGAIP